MCRGLIIGILLLLSAVQCFAAESPAVRRVVLLNSGVGYFQFEGEVHDTETIDLAFNATDINDALKSLVLQDLNGGRIRSAEYNLKSQSNSRAAMDGFQIAQAPSMANLLQQFQGEEITAIGVEQITGRILSIEQRSSYDANTRLTIGTDVLNLLTKQGIQQLDIHTIQRFEFVNPEIAKRLNDLLEQLAANRKDNRQTLKIQCEGQGNRQVRIGYVHEVPVWKASYRLELGQQSATLQGWAVVENTTQTDWKDVQLSLISGNPVSFQMNLLDPVFVNRQRVAVMLGESTAVQLHSPSPRRGRSNVVAGGQLGGGNRGLGGFGVNLGGMIGGMGGTSEEAGSELVGRGVEADTTTSEVGAMFQYQLEKPVSLKAQTSAMLPIIQFELPAERIVLFNQTTHPKYPLNAVRITNNSKQFVSQGPITVYDQGVFAGDALVRNLANGETRLISYALDAAVEIDVQQEESKFKTVSVAMEHDRVQFILERTRRDTFTVNNQAAELKQVLLELDRNEPWELVDDDAVTESTRSLYRFQVAAPAEQTLTKTVVRRDTIKEEVLLTRMSREILRQYDATDVLTDSQKQLFSQIIQLRTKITELEHLARSAQERRREITGEQDRIRANLQAIERNTALYQQFLRQITEQEKQIGEFDQQIAEFADQAKAMQQQLAEVVSPFAAKSSLRK
ncbi:MAG: DUF4139 domain-containing protein [Planctomycetales bacterium]|nr:DUF4139 domain-containing protein [Planctomycetales bacterium]